MTGEDPPTTGRRVSWEGRSLEEDEVVTLRQDTPSASHHIHLNHASSSLPPLEVTAAIRMFLDAESAAGVHVALDTHAEMLAEARANVGRLIGAKPANIALVETATRGWGLALGAAVAGKARHLATVRTEWGSNLLNAVRLRADGRLAIDVVATRPDGRPDVALLRDATAPHGIVAYPLVPTSNGLVTEAVELAALAHGRRALVFIDGSQAVGQRPVDVGCLGADVLVFPARKWLRGPKGVAALYVSDRALEAIGPPPLLDHAGASWTPQDGYRPGEGAARFESFDFGAGARLGFGAAAALALRLGPDRIKARIRALVEHAFGHLSRRGLPLPFESLEGPTSGILTWPATQAGADALRAALHGASIDVAAIGPEYARLALADRKAEKLLRLSIHYFNTIEEIEASVDRMADIRRRLGGLFLT